MNCLRCGNDIGEISEVYVATVNRALSPVTGQGLELHDSKGVPVYWMCEMTTLCRKCRPNHLYTAINWNIVPTETEPSGKECADADN